MMGAGGLGGLVTAHLLETGHDVVCVTTNDAIASAVAASGFRVRGDDVERAVPGTIARKVPDGPFDFVILAVQPPQVEEAARQAMGALAPGGKMVCLQNGLCEPRVEAVLGEGGRDRVYGAVVAWGGAMPEPGVYDRTANGGFTIGRYDGRPLDPDARDLAQALEAIGPVETTQNLRGKRFSKLAINCAISSIGTLAGERLGPLMQHRFIRRLALEIMTECVHVARKEGVRLEKVSGTIDLEWIALDEAEREAAGSPSLVAKHALLLGVGFRYRRMRSSMLSAIERGREPAVDFLNGEIVSRGRTYGVPTPVNALVREMVWDISKNGRKPGLETLRELFDRTGPHGG